MTKLQLIGISHSDFFGAQRLKKAFDILQPRIVALETDEIRADVPHNKNIVNLINMDTYILEIQERFNKLKNKYKSDKEFFKEEQKETSLRFGVHLNRFQQPFFDIIKLIESNIMNYELHVKLIEYYKILKMSSELKKARENMALNFPLSKSVSQLS